MDTNNVIEVGRELLLLAILLASPIVAVSLAVGLLVSILQTLTSIQEQTLTFAPRIIAVSLAISFALPWMLKLLADFTIRMFTRMVEVVS